MQIDHPAATANGVCIGEATTSSIVEPSSRSLYYALDTNPHTLFQLRQSVNSVRRFAPALPIYAVIAGNLSIADIKFLDSVDVRVIRSRIENGVSPTFMKWRALADLPPQREFLYLDTDTFVFDDPMRLFESAGGEDFHARPELACERDQSAYPLLINVLLLTKSHVDHWLFEKIAEHLNANIVPIFNTGIMLFRNGFATRLGNEWRNFVTLNHKFRSKRLPYPCWAAHILEEIVASLVLGAMDQFTWSKLGAESCPCYEEYRGRNVQTPGVVLHAWSRHYASCLFDFVSKDDALSYRALRHPAGNRSSISTQIAAHRLLLGSMWMRLPKTLLETWVRIGS
jgi:hypothetical protein